MEPYFNAIKQNAGKFVNKLTLIEELKFIGMFDDASKDFVSIYGSLDLHRTDEIASETKVLNIVTMLYNVIFIQSIKNSSQNNSNDIPSCGNKIV